MYKISIFFFLILLAACNQHNPKSTEKIITVSIPPFKYFIEEIGGKDFSVNVMVPAGANPHIYEPVPEQITKLRNSVAYISNGYLGFEMTWLDRFYETNSSMKRVSLSENIDLIKPLESHDAEHSEGADPHYWVSPKCALKMAATVKNLLTDLIPGNSDKYELNYLNLVKTINGIDIKATELFAGCEKKSFMIFHPTLGYLARDYGLREIAVENEGKEPTPSSLKALIDIGKSEKIGVIFVQKEYDIKNARAIAQETGAVIETIDPLSEDWGVVEMQIINSIYKSLKGTGN